MLLEPEPPLQQPQLESALVDLLLEGEVQEVLPAELDELDELIELLEVGRGSSRPCEDDDRCDGARRMVRMKEDDVTSSEEEEL